MTTCFSAKPGGVLHCGAPSLSSDSVTGAAEHVEAAGAVEVARIRSHNESLEATGG